MPIMKTRPPDWSKHDSSDVIWPLIGCWRRRGRSLLTRAHPPCFPRPQTGRKQRTVYGLRVKGGALSFRHGLSRPSLAVHALTDLLTLTVYTLTDLLTLAVQALTNLLTLTVHALTDLLTLTRRTLTDLSRHRFFDITDLSRHRLYDITDLSCHRLWPRPVLSPTLWHHWHPLYDITDTDLFHHCSLIWSATDYSNSQGSDLSRTVHALLGLLLGIQTDTTVTRTHIFGRRDKQENTTTYRYDDAHTL